MSEMFVLPQVNKARKKLLLSELSVAMVLIDARPFQDYINSFIRSAINVDLSIFNNEMLNSTNLNQVKAKRIEYKNNVMEVIEDEEIFHQRGLNSDLVVVYDEDAVENGSGKKLVDLLNEEHYVSRTLLLEGGYRMFEKKYPFLCVSKSNLLNENLQGLFPSEVIPEFLYLGDVDIAKNKTKLEVLGITHILNVSAEIENYFPSSFHYHQIHVNDTENDDLYSHFNECFTFIESAKSVPGSRVFVHCALGISRSATVVIAYVMKCQKIPLKDAVDIVKRARQQIHPNNGFLQQLDRYEAEIFQLTRSSDYLRRSTSGRELPPNINHENRDQNSASSFVSSNDMSKNISHQQHEPSSDVPNGSNT